MRTYAEPAQKGTNVMQNDKPKAEVFRDAHNRAIGRFGNIPSADKDDQLTKAITTMVACAFDIDAAGMDSVNARTIEYLKNVSSAFCITPQYPSTDRSDHGR